MWHRSSDGSVPRGQGLEGSSGLMGYKSRLYAMVSLSSGVRSEGRLRLFRDDWMDEIGVPGSTEVSGLGNKVACGDSAPLDSVDLRRAFNVEEAVARA
jgi:hypothetical protein